MAKDLPDSEIWDYVQVNDWVIVSKDTDFSDRIMKTEPPPRVVHLRFGNLKRNDFHTHLSRVWKDIEELLMSHKLVNVYLDRIEAIKR